MHATGRSDFAVLVVTLAAVPRDPIIDQRVAGAGIETAPSVITEPGKIADTAEIEHTQRPPQAFGAGPVIAWRQRRALAASGDISGAKIMHHRDSRRRLQQCAIADLPCPAAIGPMCDGMAVKADERDILAGDLGGREQPVDGDGVEAGEFGGDGIDQRIGAGAVELERVGGGIAQAADEIGFIGDRDETARDDDALAIGIDQRGVDAVHRSAGHEADGGGEIGHEVTIAGEFLAVMPAQAGIQLRCRWRGFGLGRWMPACAGMTGKGSEAGSRVKPGMTGKGD